MSRAVPVARMRRPQPSICQLCESVTSRQYHAANSSLRRPISLHVRNGPRRDSESPLQKRRVLSASVIPSASGTGSSDGSQSAPPPTPKATSHELSSITNMMAYIANSKSKALSQKKIPKEEDVIAALHSCKVVADYIMDESVQPQISHMINEMDSTASNLLSLDSNGSRSSKKSEAANPGISAQLKQMVVEISKAAYEIVAYPSVIITPKVLQQYVAVQARLGKPETLPGILKLYASKPVPREASGGIIEYTAKDPKGSENAVDLEVIENALDTAIEAKNLDAAVGVIESSLTTPAFLRSKLVRQAMLPLTAFAATPLAAYAVATNYANLQNTMDPQTATTVAFGGIVAYVGFTAAIGAVALTTANDQMQRVSWANGVPLRLRWLREEERAALDKVACAWGFREKWRQGEEEGKDWDALREYIMQKGMILDRTELMEGMQ